MKLKHIFLILIIMTVTGTLWRTSRADNTAVDIARCSAVSCR